MMRLLKNSLLFIVLAFSRHNCFAVENFNKLFLDDSYIVQIQPYDQIKYPEFAIDMNNYIRGETEREFKSKLIKHGFVVLLHAVPPEKIDEMHRLLVETYERVENGTDLTEAEKQDLKSSHISEKIFQRYNKGKSLFDVLDPDLWRLGEYFFSGVYRKNEATHTRRVRPQIRSNLPNSQPPLGIHIDAMYHGPEEFVINFWTPLEDCGIDKPTLSVFMSSCTNTLSLMNFDIARLRFDPQVYKNVEDGIAPFLQELPRFYFVMNRGDIVVLSNWTFHSGYANEQMEHPRMSMELRISGNQFWYKE